MENCAFRPKKLYLEYLDTDEMSHSVKNLSEIFGGTQNERQSRGGSNEHFQ